MKDGFLEQGLFDRLRAEFPGDAYFHQDDAEPYAGGRIDLDFGMASFDAFTGKSPVWRDFLMHMRSRRYAEFLLDVFGARLRGGRPLRRDGFAFVPTSEYIRAHRPLGRALAGWARKVEGRAASSPCFVCTQRRPGRTPSGPIHRMCRSSRASTRAPIWAWEC